MISTVFEISSPNVSFSHDLFGYRPAAWNAFLVGWSWFNCQKGQMNLVRISMRKVNSRLILFMVLVHPDLPISGNKKYEK